MFINKIKRIDENGNAGCDTRTFEIRNTKNTGYTHDYYVYNMLTYKWINY